MSISLFIRQRPLTQRADTGDRKILFGNFIREQFLFDSPCHQPLTEGLLTEASNLFSGVVNEKAYGQQKSDHHNRNSEEAFRNPE